MKEQHETRKAKARCDLGGSAGSQKSTLTKVKEFGMNDTHLAPEIKMGRRELVFTAATVGLFAASCCTPAEAETVISGKYKEWLAYYEWINANPMSDEQCADHMDELDKVMNVALSIPSADPRDAVRKLLMYTLNGDDLLNSSSALGRQVIEDLQRVAA